MAILLCEPNLYFKEAYRMPKSYDENKLTINRVGLQGDAMNVEICKDNENLDKDIIALDECATANAIHGLAGMRSLFFWVIS